MSSDGNIFDLSKYGADETGGDQFRPVSGKLGKRYPETRSLKSVRNIFDADHEPRETPAIILKWSNTGARATCGVCGGVEDRKAVGLDAFVEGTWETVCDSCIEMYAPELAEFVGMYPAPDFAAEPTNDLATELQALTDANPDSDRRATEAALHSDHGYSVRQLRRLAVRERAALVERVQWLEAYKDEQDAAISQMSERLQELEQMVYSEKAPWKLGPRND